jgi:starch synthase
LPELTFFYAFKWGREVTSLRPCTGAVPIRATGGLADTVIDYDPNTDEGTGFSCKNFNEQAFFAAIIRALETFKNKKAWQGIVRREMRQDFSWTASARKYMDLYERAITFKEESLSANPPRAFRVEE